MKNKSLFLFLLVFLVSVVILFYGVEVKALKLKPDTLPHQTTSATANQINNNLIAVQSLPTAVNNLSADLKKYENTYYGSGEDLEINGHFMNDVAVAGNNITIKGIVEGDVLALAGNLNIEADVKGNIRAAAGSIKITGTITKNVTIAAGQIEIPNTAKLNGDLVAFSNDVKINAPVAGETKIENKLKSSKSSTTHRSIDRYRDGNFWIWTALKLLALLLVALVISLLFKNTITNTVANMYCCPGKSLGFGLLFILFGPLIILMLIITLIGLPLAILSFAFYISLLYISGVLAGAAIGSKFLNHKNSWTGAMLLGTFIFYLLKILPIIGGIVSFGLSAWAIGGLLLRTKNNKKSNISSATSQKITKKVNKITKTKKK